MRIVIKFAGALLEDDATVRELARQVAALAQEGHEILVVHGGGKLFTATLKRMAIESKFVGGLRVTDRETRDAAIMVFAGLLNKKVAAAISAEGQPAVGVSAADSRSFLAEPMVHNEVEGGLGFVGYLTGLNLPFIESLWREGLVPVAPCLYLTDVAGVLDGEKVLSVVACQEIDSLVQCRVVSGGMVLKLEAAKRAIEGGVRQVRIVGGTAPEALLLASHAEEADSVPGTRVLQHFHAAAQAAFTAA